MREEEVDMFALETAWGRDSGLILLSAPSITVDAMAKWGISHVCPCALRALAGKLVLTPLFKSGP